MYLDPEAARQVSQASREGHQSRVRDFIERCRRIRRDPEGAIHEISLWNHSVERFQVNQRCNPYVPANRFDTSRVLRTHADIADYRAQQAEAATGDGVWPGTNEYWMVRVLLLRTLGAALFFTFLSNMFQIRALVGQDGLDPIKSSQGFSPLFIFGVSDLMLDLWTVVGMLLSLALVSHTLNSGLIVLSLWVIQLSFKQLGSSLVDHSWDWQILETTALATFLCPIASWSPYPRSCPPSRLVIWLLRWLAMRLTLEEGVSACFHSSCRWFEPICASATMTPTEIAWFLHVLPDDARMAIGASVRLLQLVAPLGLLLPYRRARITGATGMLLHQLWKMTISDGIVDGLIGLVPIIACFDDRAVRHTMPDASYDLSQVASGDYARFASQRTRARASPESRREAGDTATSVRTVLHLALVATVAVLSVWPVAETWGGALEEPASGSARGPAAYNSLGLVNKYGWSANAQHQRVGLVLTYTYDFERWHPLNLKCYPGSVHRGPCWIPWHQRLDESLWRDTTAAFADLEFPDIASGADLARFMQGLSPGADYYPRYLVSLCLKVLGGNAAALRLLGSSPHQLELAANHTGGNLQAVRLEVYAYNFGRYKYDYHNRRWNESWWVRLRLSAAPRAIPSNIITADMLQLSETAKIPQLPPHHDAVLVVAALGLFLSYEALLAELYHYGWESFLGEESSYSWFTARAVELLSTMFCKDPKCCARAIPINFSDFPLAAGSAFYFGIMLTLTLDAFHGLVYSISSAMNGCILFYAVIRLTSSHGLSVFCIPVAILNFSIYRICQSRMSIEALISSDGMATLKH
ncbi:hypothetical protein CYMTET_16564 [Cymbomonas tetramitiformis]|uniref:Lipase maturation factor 1/2 N-terminal domain-containing protein n=1 Tax=Cymbomonas tetramitiformis TaxID=36881 RepID=A0AAE0GC81_9CHLO|nr:hypothetical protein CYMTET_16564 [Cymbomonas tetramitiformis]